LCWTPQAATCAIGCFTLQHQTGTEEFGCQEQGSAGE
jgi:hypothetical protein